MNARLSQHQSGGNTAADQRCNQVAQHRPLEFHSEGMQQEIIAAQ